ncbi:MAG TPA: hypothetical protein VGT03_07925 [Candidatus Acidoferrales bacterium]|nr:hypothetical protein [Candidatus Acidoferrales bacterium]
MGFKLGGTEFLFKKGANTYQRTKDKEYPLISFAKALCPPNLSPKPPYIVLWSTESEKARALKKIGERIFLMKVDDLETRLHRPLGRKGFVVTLTSPKWRSFLDREVPKVEVKSHLEALAAPTPATVG